MYIQRFGDFFVGAATRSSKKNKKYKIDSKLYGKATPVWGTWNGCKVKNSFKTDSGLKKKEILQTIPLNICHKQHKENKKWRVYYEKMKSFIAYKKSQQEKADQKETEESNEEEEEEEEEPEDDERIL